MYGPKKITKEKYNHAMKKHEKLRKKSRQFLCTPNYRAAGDFFFCIPPNYRRDFSPEDDGNLGRGSGHFGKNTQTPPFSAAS